MSTKGQETREKILEQAVDLFCEYGFMKASTRQLVGRVGMTSSAIYNHFANKEEILFTIIQRAADRVLQTLKDTIERYDDPLECLKKMISSLLHLFSVGAMRKEIAIFIDELYQLPDEMREKCNRKHREIFNLFREKIVEIGKIRPLNSVNYTVATFGLMGATIWVYQWYRDNGELSMDEISSELIKLLFEGLLKSDQG
jgi:TetR/AcrR family transcriptional regulator, cholesterol catabolism regulator